MPLHILAQIELGSACRSAAEVPAFREHRLRVQLVVVLDDAVERQKEIFVRGRGVNVWVEVGQIGGEGRAQRAAASGLRGDRRLWWRGGRELRRWRRDCCRGLRGWGRWCWGGCRGGRRRSKIGRGRRRGAGGAHAEASATAAVEPRSRSAVRREMVGADDIGVPSPDWRCGLSYTNAARAGGAERARQGGDITGTAPPRARSDVPPATVTPETFNRDDIRMAAIPSSGGIMTARALARHYAVLAQGGTLDGVRLLTPERISLATELQTAAVDELDSQAIKRSLGYRLGDDAGPYAGPGAFGHVGNGMFGYAEPERQFAVAFLRNYAARRGTWGRALSRPSMPNCSEERVSDAFCAAA